MGRLKIKRSDGRFAGFFGIFWVFLLASNFLCQPVSAQRRPPSRAGDEGLLGQMIGQPAPVERELEPEHIDPDEIPPPPDQNYDELPVDEKQKKQRFAIGRILLAGKFAGNQDIFDEYYTTYALARWTHWDNIASLQSFRKDLRNDFRRAKSGQVYDHLNALVLNFMDKLVTGSYNQPAQVNAMLAIGDLNLVEPSMGTEAAPLPDAMKALGAAVENAELSDAIRAVAMIGILRHAEAGIEDAAAQRSVAAAMLKLLAADVPTGPAGPGREWILAQAAETLGFLGSVGDGNAVFNAMLKNVAETKRSFSTRSIVAKSLGRLNYAGVAGINPMKAAAVLAQFATDACTDELQLVKNTQNPVNRRRIKQRLDAVLSALNGEAGGNRKGIMSLAREQAQRKSLGELRKSLGDLSALLDDRRRAEDDMAPSVEQLRTKLEAWAKGAGS